eukprot:6174277-Pleurochrysis_carterae.AAC.1
MFGRLHAVEINGASNHIHLPWLRQAANLPQGRLFSPVFHGEVTTTKSRISTLAVSIRSDAEVIIEALGDLTSKLDEMDLKLSLIIEARPNLPHLPATEGKVGTERAGPSNK